jgi:voltage-gated potassium channel
VFSGAYRKFVWAGAILLAILLIGTVGYWFIGGRQYSFVDTLYMTIITISTIGFGEIIDLSGNTVGRIFTIFIAVSGVGVLLYFITNLTALIVEGKLTESFRRRRMEKTAGNSSDHYIVCGVGRVGFHIVSELHATNRRLVVVDTDKEKAERCLELFRDQAFIEGDATNSETLLKAGIEKARGLFAVTGDDNQNLVVSLTAKQLNPNLRVVARCNEVGNSQKMRKAGADAIVSPTSIGGLRMASEMVRPTVVSFLDTMLRDREKGLRIEELRVPQSFVGKSISALDLNRYPHVVLLAVRTGEDWVYRPSQNHVIAHDSTLVFVTTPEEREKLVGLLEG